MTKQVVDIGTIEENGRDGDNARTSFTKVNENFTELYTSVDALTIQIGDVSAALDAINGEVV